MSIRQHWENPAFATPENKCCPYCGGDSGFQFRWASVSTQYYDWEGYPQGSSEPNPLFTRKLRCSDCGKMVEKFIDVIGLAP